MLAERPEDRDNEPQNNMDLDHVTSLSELPFEKQFAVLSFERQVDQMSREQAQDFLKALNRSFIAREEMYKRMLKSQWIDFGSDLKGSQAA